MMKIFPLQLRPQQFSIILFITSLFLPAMYIEHDYINYAPSIAGYDALLSGWGAILDGCPAWLANITFAAAYLTSKKIKLSIFFSLLSIILGLTSYFYKSMWNDGDGAIQITSLAAGFYVWLSAFGWLTIVRAHNFSNARVNA